jgi:hypothetical protein
MATLNKAVQAPEGKKITVKEAKAQAPKLIKTWGGNEFAAGVQQRIATSLLPGVVAVLRNANYTALSVKAKGDKATTADKAKARGLFNMVLASLPDSYPEEFNEHRRKSMATEMKDLMAEVDSLRSHTQKDGD